MLKQNYAGLFKNATKMVCVESRVRTDSSNEMTSEDEQPFEKSEC